MKKVLLTIVFIAGSFAVGNAQEKLKEEGGNECPDLCSAPYDVLCCTLASGTTFYGHCPC